ncbi:uncharacterized protein LOC127566215 [Drosophila albomicans]|uniref:Uncharacterized protein LOC127566215 n=1 Tax=Drosophila albomicans TaxID=7291 RepID=A0A9C6T3C7_DROAB|nr:uncharacterized protein LOC127566215 [Drosophila albomicans]
MSGALLLEMKKGTQVSTDFINKIKGALQKTAEVKELKPTSTLEIWDLDALTTANEVEEAIQKILPDIGDRLKVVVTKPNSREQQMCIGKSPNMKILQANMHRSKTADSLLSQLVLEKAVDVVIISEQYKTPNNGTFLTDNTGTAAIWLPNINNFTVTRSGAGQGFVWAQTKICTIMSCYLTPSDSINEFKTKLDAIEDQAQQLGGDLIIAGDFNSRAIEPGCEGTIPDITLAAERAANRLQEWGVLKDYTGSDHQYICFSINSNHRRRPDHDKKTTRRWNAKKLDTEKLIEVLDARMETGVDPRDARSIVRHTMRAIEHSCAAAMPKTTSFLKRKAAYWWNEQIAELRRACLRARKKMTRARSRSSATAEIEDHKEARKRLKLAIVHSKKSKWEELRNDINTNPWVSATKS